MEPFNNNLAVEEAEDVVECAVQEFSELLSSLDCLIHSPATGGKQKRVLKDQQTWLVGFMTYIEKMDLET